MTARIRILPSAQAVADALSADIADRMAAHDAGPFVLGCPSGRSGRLSYLALARRIADDGLDVRNLVIAMMDEYLVGAPPNLRAVPLDAECSGAAFARNEIAGPINSALRGAGRTDLVTPEQLWLPDPADPAGYDARLADAGGIDLFILATGSGDGHVAFNPPGSGADSGSRIVELAEQTRRDNLATFPGFGSLENVPSYGVTVGISTITALSKAAVLIATGAEKAPAIARIAAADGYDAGWPATVVHACRDPRILVDSAAGRLLDGADTGSDRSAT